jgi:hypothetical protein
MKRLYDEMPRLGGGMQDLMKGRDGQAVGARKDC